MRDEIRQAACEMVTRGIKPAAIIMTPTQLKAFQRELSTQDRMEFNHQGSGWEFEGLPIWRSWHMTGPCVVSREVFGGLRRGGTLNLEHYVRCEAAAAMVAIEQLEPFLF